MNLTPLIVALGAFSIFFATAILFRIGSRTDSLRKLSLLHLLFMPGFFAGAWFFPGISLGDWLAGLYCYFCFQYPFLFVFYGQVARGFSLNICISAWRNGGCLSDAQIYSSYGDGRGVEYVMHDRLKVMLESGVAREYQDRLTLTFRGRYIVRLNKLLLRTYRLDYLGRSQQPGAQA